MSNMALEVKNLESWYGESHILHGVNFAVRDGEVVTLLGRNGAGRSTILKTILGLTSKRKGSISVFGTETTSLPTYQWNGDHLSPYLSNCASWDWVLP